MKKNHRIVSLLLAALMAFGLLTTAFAATDSAFIKSSIDICPGIS